MCEREKEVYESRMNSYFGMTLFRLAKKFGHDSLIAHADMCDNL